MEIRKWVYRFRDDFCGCWDGIWERDLWMGWEFDPSLVLVTMEIRVQEGGGEERMGERVNELVSERRGRETGVNALFCFFGSGLFGFVHVRIGEMYVICSCSREAFSFSSSPSLFFSRNVWFAA
jgi:hypothetical protein